MSQVSSSANERQRKRSCCTRQHYRRRRPGRALACHRRSRAPSRRAGGRPLAKSEHWKRGRPASVPSVVRRGQDRGGTQGGSGAKIGREGGEEGSGSSRGGRERRAETCRGERDRGGNEQDFRGIESGRSQAPHQPWGVRRLVRGKGTQCWGVGGGRLAAKWRWLAAKWRIVSQGRCPAGAGRVGWACFEPGTPDHVLQAENSVVL